MGVSGVASLITTDEQLKKNRCCCFLVQAMLPEGFSFHQFMHPEHFPKNKLTFSQMYKTEHNQDVYRIEIKHFYLSHPFILL